MKAVLLYREKFLQEVNSLIQKPSHPLAKTKTLVKSLMNRAELLLHVTIAAQSGLTRSISGTPAETPGTAALNETVHLGASQGKVGTSQH